MTWQVLDLLQSRVPALSWHPGRIGLVIDDHPQVDALAVAGRCADWIVFQADRVADGPATYRRFMEKASAEPHLVDVTEPTDLAAYDLFVN